MITAAGATATRITMLLPVATSWAYRWCGGDQFLGVANIVADAARPFGDPDVELMIMLAMQATTAIRNAQLYAAAQQEIAERRRAEESLVVVNRQLEQRVQERTAGLERTQPRAGKRDCRAQAGSRSSWPHNATLPCRS